MIEELEASVNSSRNSIMEANSERSKLQQELECKEQALQEQAVQVEVNFNISLIFNT